MMMTRHRLLTMAIPVLLSAGLSLAETADPAPRTALTKKALKAAIENAKTPQDHQRIADYYKAEATRMDAEAKEHEELAAAYAKAGSVHGTKHPMSGQTAEHCQHFAEAARKASQAARELAKMHEGMK